MNAAPVRDLRKNKVPAKQALLKDWQNRIGILITRKSLN